MSAFAKKLFNYTLDNTYNDTVNNTLNNTRILIPQTMPSRFR